jgi:radical SAM protein with 4Fe4S-binding SPASM domain
MDPLAIARKLYRRLRPARDHWTHFLSIVDRRSLEHDAGLDARAKRELFKRNVDLVELEPHAYCNRTCSFCPNATIDRLTVKTTLDRALYESVLDDLKSIGYDRVLRFARYSEPMAHEHIYEMVALARRRLPAATIDIVTNGDYLNPRALARLREAGLSVLRVSVYMRRGVAWSVEAARDEITRLGRRIQLEPAWDASTATTVGASFTTPGLPIVAFSHNFDETGYDRGQLIEQLVDKSWVRRSPCFLVFSNFTVDFNGTVMPCCNLRSDHPKHKAFAVGDLARSSIFDVYAGAEFTAWRRSLATVGEKADPCRTCRQKALEGPELERLGRAVDARLRALGVNVP